MSLGYSQRVHLRKNTSQYLALWYRRKARILECDRLFPILKVFTVTIYNRGIQRDPKVESRFVPLVLFTFTAANWYEIFSYFIDDVYFNIECD